MKRMDLESFVSSADARRRPYHSDYLSMYSSLYGAVTTDPVIMSLPLDDHIVHRGDGLFEALKCVDGCLYNLRAHLDRLEGGLEKLKLDLPCPRDELEGIIVETVRIGDSPDAVVRLYVSRGPGSFGVSPYDCPEPQFYVVVTSAKAPFMSRHPAGASGCTSTVLPKAAFFAKIKSVNYIVNVMMKREAVDRGVDFVAAFDARGCLTEGATENVGLVVDGRLVFPRLDGILTGTTMMRVMALAEGLVAAGTLKSAEFADIPGEMVSQAEEMLVVGTTWDVSSAVSFDGKVVGEGVPGPVASELNRLLLDDMRRPSALLTPVWPRVA